MVVVVEAVVLVVVVVVLFALFVDLLLPFVVSLLGACVKAGALIGRRISIGLLSTSLSISLDEVSRGGARVWKGTLDFLVVVVLVDVVVLVVVVKLGLASLFLDVFLVLIVS